MKRVKLLETMPIHGALVSKGDAVELDKKEADLLVKTDRAEYVESAAEAPTVSRGKAKKGPGGTRVLDDPENRGRK